MWGTGEVSFSHRWNNRHRFYTCRCHLLTHNRSRLRGCCYFEFLHLRFRLISGGCHSCLLRRICERVGGWFGSWRISGIDNSHPSDEVTPTPTQTYLLSRGPCLLRIRGNRLTRCYPLALLRHSLRKSGLRFFPRDIALIVGCVVANAAVTQGLHSRGRANTGEVRAEECVRSSAACGRSVGSACITEDTLVPCTFPPSLADCRVR
jgi:hypothetical protein